MISPLEYCLIDKKYVIGRDNHICQNCKLDLSQTYPVANLDYSFLKIDPSKGTETTNIVLVCHNCAKFNLVSSNIIVDTCFSGHLIVITGSMYSEKSTTSESYFHNYGVKFKNRIWTKPDIDDRAIGLTTTHNNRNIEARTISADRPDKHLQELLNFQLVVVDEAQFFSERIIYTIHQLLKNDILVIINGLKMTANRDLFGVMHYLMAEADEVISLKAVCNVCMRVNCATRTKTFINDSPAVNTGGADKYYAVCSSCDGDIDEKHYLKKIVKAGA